MTPAQAARLLALPPTVRATLAGVPGPGWSISDWHECRGRALAYPGPEWLEAAGSWWPANPAAAVAAVLGCSTRAAYLHVYGRMVDASDPSEPDDDHAAALSIIENHVRSRP